MRASLILILLAGCAVEDPDGPPAVLLDDDDSAVDSDDDDSSVVPGPALLQAWVSDVELLGAGPDPLGRSHAEAAALTSAAPLGAWRLADGTPVPGLGLHPDRGDLVEACEVFDATSFDGLPAGFDVGAALVLAPSAGDSVALPWDDGRYRLDEGPRLEGASAWTLSSPDATWSVALSAPPRPTGVQPGPGTISLLGPRSISWAPGGGPVEIVLLRFASAVNRTNWEAVRCVAEDDGSFLLDPTPLAGPFSGDLLLTVTRSTWSADGTTLFSRSTAADAHP